VVAVSLYKIAEVLFVIVTGLCWEVVLFHK